MNAALPAGLKGEHSYQPKTIPYLKISLSYATHPEFPDFLKKNFSGQKSNGKH
jgi:hypothetical protein